MAAQTGGRSAGLLLALGFGLVVACFGDARAQSSGIGVAATSVRQVTGDAGGGVREIGVGNAVFEEETIATGQRSNTQLLFRDETTLNVGPTSSVVLDRFVYNPSGSANEISVELTRGALRFVSGRSRSNAYTIRTPIATIGVRGTILDVFSFPGFTIVILTEGGFDGCFNGRCVAVVRPGTYVIIYADGRVQGPKRWDGALKRLVGPIPFPLFGWHLDLDRLPRYVYDQRRDDTDQLERFEEQDYEPPYEPPPNEIPVDPPLQGIRQ